MDHKRVFYGFKDQELQKYEEYLDSSGSNILRFVEKMEDQLRVSVDRLTGLICSVDDMNNPSYPISLPMQLNNQLVEIEQLYFDESKVIFRLTNKDLRRISLSTIKFIRNKDHVFNVSR